MNVINKPQVYMEPGTYYVGDLCYVLGDRWNEVCDLTIRGNDVLDGGFMLKDGTEFATFTTAWGDGTYYDQESRNYSVDAGLIGCVRIESIDDEPSCIDGGCIIEFTKPFICEKIGGTIYFGKVAIDTDPWDFNNDEDEEEYDDE